MNRILAALPAILLLLQSFNGFSQTNFSADSEKFLSQVESFLGQHNKKEAKDFIAGFTPVWNGIPGNIKTNVYQMANMLSGKMVKPYPEFWGYMAGVKRLAEQNQLTSIYPGWVSVINSTAEARDKKQLPEFLTFSYHFYTEGIVYVSSSSKWQCTGNNYEYGYESNTPRLVFSKTDLKCFAKNDSSVVYNTSGILLPLKDKFYGKGGVVTWERAGLSKDQTWADLNNYDVTLRSVGFDADTVSFHTPYFKDPLIGRMIEKIVSLPKTSAATYPQFNSYSKRLFIKNIFENIDYEGGFSMEGARLLGFGTADQEAKLRCYRNNKLILGVFSRQFTIKPESIDAEKAGINVYIEDDSISHPYLRFKYQKSSNTFIMSRDKSGFSQSPFFNTYHKLEMYFEALIWKMENPFMEFGAVAANSIEKTARFESSNFFSQEMFNILRGMDRIHPMVPIEELSRRLDTTLLKLPEVASFMGKPTEQIMPVIGALSGGGFISYDPESQIILVKRKLFDYLKASAKRIDYDPIEILSEVESQVNASFNILSNELLIKGVKRVTLSDSQFVRIYPDKQELIVLKNRDMRFAGIINAGNTEYFGKEFFMSYDNFKIDLLKCDSMRLRVWPLEGKGAQIRVKSVIRNVQGTIVIDGKNNKSGLKKGFEKYPVLTSTAPTFVFYNDKAIYNSVYDSSSFYFKIDPFVMDSLDNFNGKFQRFPGTFYSAGIIPVIKEELGVMKDYSLGFLRKLPPEGISLYGDKAVFNNEIRLSNKGLQADGSLKFLTSTADSKAFTLFPDSLSGIAEKYVNVEVSKDPEVPSVRGSGILVRYHPRAKVMYAQSTDSLLHMFTDCKMRGTAELRPKGMTGRGRIYFENAEIASRNFVFKSNIIDADTAAFRLKNKDLDQKENELSFNTENVNAHIDFTRRYGEFKSNGEETFVEFPENQYICFMDRFKWFMDNENLELESDRKTLTIDTDLDLSGSNFFSVHPEQDSLNFMAPKATYDLRKKTITCNKVEWMNVADAKIYPDSSRIIIRKKADMETLKNAKIIANSVTQYHTIYNATVKVSAKKKYEAEGDYSYKDENKREQIIHFAKITLDTSLQTYAKGEISAKENFMLSLHFEYYGNVELKAADVGLNFDGGVRLVEACSGIDSRWFRFKGVVDPNDIRIPVGDELVNYEDGGFLGAGLSLNNDSISLYPSFLSEKIKKTHPDIIQSSGFLIFDKKSQEYQIAKDDKLKERTLPGNFVSFGKEKCEISGDGKLSFGADLGQMKLTPIGTITHDIQKGTTRMKVSLLIDFPFPDNAMDKIADKVNNYPDLEVFDYTRSNYEKALRELVGLEKSDKVIADLGLHGEVKKFPEELSKTIFLSDITFKWDPIEQHWISEGKIGVSNFYKSQVFKYIDGRIRIKKGRAYDEIEFVLKLDDSNWYYFGYSREMLDLSSSDNGFKETIEGTKDDKRKYKGEKGLPDFEFRYNNNKRSRAQSLFNFE